ncbi:FecR family protein [Plebeiibacterium sediminum]|uniref:DUF4974 domain-containing protein n=1 Tax=Plebeiibacterium sediminum TaxID=2992112 RepID=A0AAE3M633_9BACT|nr:FecR domain-containing protein [Plebeiobacterium sediminum]MCW3787763.1 DUF4974 domain-containing protein [Plebeiobacterium sediminum]
MKNSQKLHKETRKIGETIINSLEKDNNADLGLKNKQLENVFNYFLSNNNLVNHINKYKKYSSKEGYERFLLAIEDLPANVNRKSLTLKYWMYGAAASIILIIGFSLFLMQPKQYQHQANISHGISKSTLILSNGKTITASAEDFTYEQQNMSVKYQQGTFSYSNDVSSDELVENTLVVPVGGEANMTLSDGTKVWVNADSYLKHPVRFIGKTREVTISGEVFFEVAEDKEHPFIVHTNNGDVKVLGTGFGISSYPDENAYVTLAHGKIAFSDNSHETMYLEPGEQIKIVGDEWEKRVVNVDEYVGWKDGKFVFNDRRLSDIMNTMERWYDVDVVFDSPTLKDIRFSGDIKRYGSINVLLDALVLTREMEYSIEDSTIILYQK